MNMEEDITPKAGMKRREGAPGVYTSEGMEKDPLGKKKQRVMEEQEGNVAGPTQWALGEQ